MSVCSDDRLKTLASIFREKKADHLKFINNIMKIIRYLYETGQYPLTTGKIVKTARKLKLEFPKSRYHVRQTVKNFSIFFRYKRTEDDTIITLTDLGKLYALCLIEPIIQFEPEVLIRKRGNVLEGAVFNLIGTIKDKITGEENTLKLLFKVQILMKDEYGSVTENPERAVKFIGHIKDLWKQFQDEELNFSKPKNVNDTWHIKYFVEYLILNASKYAEDIEMRKIIAAIINNAETIFGEENVEIIPVKLTTNPQAVPAKVYKIKLEDKEPVYICSKHFTSDCKEAKAAKQKEEKQIALR